MSGKSTVRICTCDGLLFYCPEVLACVLLKLLPQYKDASIVRSRNQSVLDACDIVVGVGGMYDPSRHRYDPKAKGFQELMSTVIRPGYNWTKKLSSAGLVYYHFGHEILKSVLSDVTEDDIEKIFKIIYEVLIKEIDAVDLDMYDAVQVQVYRSNTDLSGRVSRLNPLWAYEDLNNICISGNILVKNQFERAMTLVQEEFLETVQYARTVWLRVTNTMRRAVVNRFEVDTSGEIMTITPYFWYEEFLFCLEKEMNVSPSIKMLLPESWGGLRTNALVKACGIEGALHVSLDRSFGSHKTKEGAMAMARKALMIGKTIVFENVTNTKDR